MLICSTRYPPIPLHLHPGGVDKLSIFDLNAGHITFTPSGLKNINVLHAYYWLTVTERFSLHCIPSIWQRSFSIASAVASSSCGSSSPAGTESGLGRSDRQLSEEHSSAAPCCCLYRWCSTRNCSSGAAVIRITILFKKWRRKVSNKSKVRRSSSCEEILGELGRAWQEIGASWRQPVEK